MNRTLHVIDQPVQTAEAAVLRLSVDAVIQQNPSQGEQHAWLLFGGQTTRDAAHAVGLEDNQFCLLPRPVGLHKLIPAALVKPKQIMARSHRVVCWTEGAAQIASLLCCANVVRRIHHATHCPTAQRIITQAHQTLRCNQSPDRATLRERWGVEQGTTVIALIGDRFDRIDASAAMMAIALTHEALHAIEPELEDVRLLCHPLAKRRGEAAELSGLLKLDHLLIQDASINMPWSVLAGCDAALVLNPSESGLSILWVQAMGVPIVSPQDERLPTLNTLSQFVPARSTKPRDLADAVTQWLRTNATAQAT